MNEIRTGKENRTRTRGPRCTAGGRVQMTDICSDVKTLSQMLLMCERRFAGSLAAEDHDRAGRWANVAEALLLALRPVR